MENVFLIGILLFAAIGGFLAFVVFSPQKTQQPEMLAPIAVLPVRNADASTRAFLELFAGQVAWMDSSILHSVVLIYTDNDDKTAQMCAEITQQYDFFTCMSLSEVQRLFALRMEVPDGVEKNFESGCNLSENAV
ncbi:MAG: hypothetical protein E7504_03850 [Ruminococcus sp.]|nr:hypothetical protein [Ruminococcus sp.]